LAPRETTEAHPDPDRPVEGDVALAAEAEDGIGEDAGDRGEEGRRECRRGDLEDREADRPA